MGQVRSSNVDYITGKRTQVNIYLSWSWIEKIALQRSGNIYNQQGKIAMVPGSGSQSPWLADDRGLIYALGVLRRFSMVECLHPW